MGVIHKLSLEIRNLIVQRKKNNPGLSCRILSLQLEKEFKLKISKSSINAIFKEGELSLPVGRRLRKKKAPKAPAVSLPKLTLDKPLPLKKEREKLPLPPAAAALEVVKKEISPRPPEKLPLPSERPVFFFPPGETTSAILLKAVDYLSGTSACLARALGSGSGIGEKEALRLSNYLLYSGCAEGGDKFSALPLAEMPPFDPHDLLCRLAQNQALLSRLIQQAPESFQEVRSIKLESAAGWPLYIDAGLYALWPNPQTPYNLSVPLCYLKDALANKAALVLLSAGNPLALSQEDFELLLCCAGEKGAVEKLALCGNNGEVLQELALKNSSLIFGLWPWQFKDCRRLISSGNFLPLKENPAFYFAEIEIELRWPNTDSRLCLSGCALKNTPAEKIRLALFSSLPKGKLTAQELASIYLQRWPAPEEAMKELCQRAEFFAYLVGREGPYSLQGLSLETSSNSEEFFNRCLMALDLYLRQRFFPLGYEKMKFSQAKEKLYSLKAVVVEEKNDRLYVSLLVPAGSAQLAGLSYCCQRLNEKDLVANGNKKVTFQTKN